MEKRDGKFSKGSIWWRDLGSIDNCLMGARNWFSDGIEKKVGNGYYTLFWRDLWVDRLPLSVKYPRLYIISKGKMMEVQKLGKWVNGGFGSYLGVVDFFVWEQEFCEQLQEEIQHVNLIEDETDSWRWRLNGNGVYTVKSAYSVLISEPAANGNRIFK